MLQEVHHHHIAFYQQVFFGHLYDFRLDLVGFVPNFTNQLFQDIFHGSDTQSSAVIVGDDGHMELGAAHLIQNFRQALGLGNEQRLCKHCADIGSGVVQQRFEQYAHRQDTDDVIDAVFVHGNAGILAGQRGLNGLFDGVVDVQSGHFHPVGDDLMNFNIVKFNGGLEEFYTGFFQDTLFFDHFHHGHQVVVSDGIICFCLDPNFGDQGDHLHKQPNDGRGDFVQQVQKRRREQRVLVAELLCHLLGQNLTKDQQQHGHNTGGNSHTCITHKFQRNHSCNGRGGNVYQIVADEDGAKGFVIMLADI